MASTGYAIGDDEALNYTELLMLNYSQELLSGSGYAGQALLDAKLAYLGALGTITNYDQKVSIEMTLYGLPHYQAVTPATVAAASAIQTQLNSMAAITLPAGPGATYVETLTFAPVLDRRAASGGSYDAEVGYSDGDYETVPGRPIMPRIVEDLAALDEGPVHGAVMVSGAYALEDPFDPWIGVPMIEWTEVPPEAQVCLPIYWPTPVKLNSIGSDDGLDQRVIVYPAAFRCDPSLSSGGVIGQYRTFNSQTVQLYRSTSPDITPPIIHEVTLDNSAVSNGIVVTVDASDSESDLVEVLVVRYRDSDLSVATVAHQPPVPAIAGVFSVEVSDFEADDQFVVHVIDAAGNVGTNSAKGYLLQFIDVDAENALGAPEVPMSLTATVFGFAAVGSSPGLTQPTRFLWNFGDNEGLSGDLSATNPDLLDFTVDSNGNARFSVAHTYAAGTSGPLVATVRVVDSNGSIGFDSADVFMCTDPNDVVLNDPTINADHADIVGCGASIDGDDMTITLYMAGDLTDALDPIGDIQYRLRLGLVGQSNEKLVKYRDGGTTGMRSLSVVLDGNAIHFTFSLKELGRKGQLSDAAVTFSAETRDGAASTGSAGLLDWMPDDGNVVVFHE